MKRFLLVLALLATAFSPLRAQISESQRKQLCARLDEYFAAMAGMNAAEQNAECDFIISSCSDSLVRQLVTLYVYDHYLQSPILGDDAVAVHVADTWLLSGKVKMKGDMDLVNARLFADFNRSSLIGMKAPPITLRDASYEAVTLFGEPSPCWRILSFYDSSCATCRAEAPLLQALLEERDDPVEFLAVYVGDDDAAWRNWQAEHLSWNTEHLRIRNLWDPEGESDFQMQYGVISTPKIFLIAPDGTIAGRGLDPESLVRLLQRCLDGTDYDYGSEEALAALDEAFSAGVDSPDDVLEVADYIAGQTLGAGDVTGFRHAIGDLFYWTATRRGEAVRLGAEALSDKYILCEGSLFTTPDDSLKVLGFARMVKDLMQLAPVGGKVPKFHLPGTLVRRGKEKDGRFRLRCLHGKPAYVVFYTHGCNRCEETLAAARALTEGPENKGVKVLLVDMDRLFSTDPQLGTRLLESFDLSVLPFVIQLDRRGVVRRKYIELH